MSTRIFAVLLAIAPLVPHAALGTEAGAAGRSESFAPSAIPYAETIPSLAHTSQTKIELPKLGLLLKPTTLDFARVRIEPAYPSAWLLPDLITRPASLNSVPR